MPVSVVYINSLTHSICIFDCTICNEQSIKENILGQTDKKISSQHGGTDKYGNLRNVYFAF